MNHLARGNEIASSVAGIALVGEMLRSCPSFSEIDRLRLPKTSRGHVSHGAGVVGGGRKSRGRQCGVDSAGNLIVLHCEREQEIELCATFAVDEESEPVTVRKTVVIQPSNIVPTTFELRKGWNLLACPFGRLTERSRADLLERFQPYHYDADIQSYVMSDGMEYNDSIWLHADSDATIVLDLMTNQPE